MIMAGATSLGHGLWNWHTQDWTRYLFYCTLALIASRMKVTLPAVRGIDKRVMLFGEGPSGIVLVIRTTDESLVRALASEHEVALWTLGVVGGDILEIAPVLGTPVEALARAHRDGLAIALGRS